MLLGAHLSASGGYPSAVDYALDVGAECIQIFAKSPRQWAGRPIDPAKAREFIRLREEKGPGPLFTHTAYLINLTTSDEAMRQRSIDALADELVRGRLLGAAGVVTHLGNDPEGDPEAAATRAADSVALAFERSGSADPDTRLLLENTAGAGSTYGSTLEQMGWILGGLAPEVREAVGLCLDTCHAHAYGMDLSSPQAWDAVLDECERHCGCGISLVHANDCLFERGSRRDRHAWIGEGHLGRDSFAAMLCRPRLATVCAITEMPGEAPMKDKENLDRLKALRSGCG